MDDTPTISNVLNSEVRKSILQHLAEENMTKMELRDQVNSSNAAVYQEIGQLADDEFITQTDDVWKLTGRGSLALSILGMQERTDTMFEWDVKEDYWTTHDPSIIPLPFQATFNLFTDGEIIRASERDTAMWRVADAIDEASHVNIIALVYDFEVGMALDRAVTRGADIRLLADTTLVDEVLRNRSNFSWEPDAVDIRVADVSFALATTDELVAISLPFLDGSFDLQTVLTSDDSLAQTWGELLFTCFWGEATPIDEYLPDGETLPIFDSEHSRSRPPRK
jgi:predicted transcriptional regulator